MNEKQRINELYNQALASYSKEDTLPKLPQPYDLYCKIIIDHQERSKAVLAVLATLLLKKLMNPDQDIRLHQSGMSEGFSGRGLDSRVVTPFLKEKCFPHMQSGSGWLTRSLEQPRPYNLHYPGNMKPAAVKNAFLKLVNGVQCHGLSAENIMITIFTGLIRFRDSNVNFVLSRPVNLSVDEVVDRISRHYSAQLQGVARLPVLATHAILSVLVREVGRYNNCAVLPLEHHNTADRRTELIGDVHIVDPDNTLFEGYEIKHNIPITSGLIQNSFEKLQKTPVKRFYILTTYPHRDYSRFQSDIQQIARAHGCQLIANGVSHTLKYYLRLTRDTSAFVHKYVSGLESDSSVSFQLKDAWNKIVQI